MLPGHAVSPLLSLKAKSGGPPPPTAVLSGLARRRVSRLLNLAGPSGAAGFIGFSQREMKRRDVVPLIGGQRTEEVCTAGKPFWFQRRVWFEIGGAIERDELGGSK